MNYALMITEEERQKLAEAFAIMARKIGSAAPVIDERGLPAEKVGPKEFQKILSGIDQARAILAPPKSAPSTSAMAQNTPPVTPSPAPIELRDRWAKDRKGKELPHPEGAEPIEVHVWKTEQAKDGKYLRVTWQLQANGFRSANCFDKDLWPWLIKQTGQPTRLYLVSKGSYTNIVGVRA